MPINAESRAGIIKIALSNNLASCDQAEALGETSDEIHILLHHDHSGFSLRVFRRKRFPNAQYGFRLESFAHFIKQNYLRLR